MFNILQNKQNNIQILTICPRSSYPFYIVTYYIYRTNKKKMIECLPNIHLRAAGYLLLLNSFRRLVKVHVRKGLKDRREGFFQVDTHKLIDSLGLDTWFVNRNNEVSIGANEPHFHPLQYLQSIWMWISSNLGEHPE